MIRAGLLLLATAGLSTAPPLAASPAGASAPRATRLGPTRLGAPRTGDPPTWAGEVARLVHARCAGCHHPGEPAPFDLLTHADVARRVDQVLAVVESGFMPPWLPEPGGVAFEGDRSLTEGELDLLRRWAAAGAPEGPPHEAPPPPVFEPGWLLGTPDLVVSGGEHGALELAADGPDAFVNLVLPTSEDATRFVRAVELRFDSPAVHHAILQMDAGGGSRRRAVAEPGPGFEGMDMGTSVPPDGHFVGWTPGHRPRENPPGLAWRLAPRADLVLQLHLTPTGKPERIAPRIGLFLTATPPDRFPYSIVLSREDIDIPPGEPRYTLRDEYELSTEVSALGVYPHAHHRGKAVRLVARLSAAIGGAVGGADGGADGGGSVAELELLCIDEWNFDWQDEYRFAAPVALPAGTRLVMEWTWDNSAANVRNPVLPPERVRFGTRSEDEMGTVTLQVLPATAEGLEALRRGRWIHELERHPDSPLAHAALGGLLADEGLALGPGPQRERLLLEARSHLERALAAEPRNADALVSAGRIAAVDDSERAQALFRAAAEADPGFAPAHVELGRALARLGREDEALAGFRGLLADDPDLHEVRLELAVWLARQGQVDEPLEQLMRVAAARPGIPEVHNNLGNLHFAGGRLDQAARQYRLALAARPDYAHAHLNLGRVLLEAGRLEQAREHLEAALGLAPASAEARASLEALHRALEAGR